MGIALINEMLSTKATNNFTIKRKIVKNKLMNNTISYL